MLADWKRSFPMGVLWSDAYVDGVSYDDSDCDEFNGMDDTPADDDAYADEMNDTCAYKRNLMRSLTRSRTFDAPSNDTHGYPNGTIIARDGRVWPGYDVYWVSLGDNERTAIRGVKKPYEFKMTVNQLVRDSAVAIVVDTPTVARSFAATLDVAQTSRTRERHPYHRNEAWFSVLMYEYEDDDDDEGRNWCVNTGGAPTKASTRAEAILKLMSDGDGALFNTAGNGDWRKAGGSELEVASLERIRDRGDELWPHESSERLIDVWYVLHAKVYTTPGKNGFKFTKKNVVHEFCVTATCRQIVHDNQFEILSEYRTTALMNATPHQHHFTKQSLNTYTT
jgi:hypothetical protein